MLTIHYIYLPLIIFFVLSTYPLATFIGMLYERKRWNKLIDMGVIPTPSKQHMIDVGLLEDDDGAA